MLSSVANSLRVLVILVQREEIGISDIGRELNLTTGTVFRLVSTLSDAGFAEQSPGNRKYRPGPRVLELANIIRSRSTFVDLAHPELEVLMRSSGETVNLGVLRGDDVVYVDRVVGMLHQLVMELRVGSVVPAYCSALGKSLLAFAEPAVRDDYLRQLPHMSPPEGMQRPSGDALATELAAVMTAGHSEDHGQYSPDIACVAAPVLDGTGRALAAVSVSGPRHRVETSVPDLIPQVRDAGKRLSEILQRIGPAFARL